MTKTIRLSDETVEVLTEHFPSAMRSRLMQIATTDEVFESPISCDCYCGESFSGTDEQEVRQLWARHAIEALSALPAVDEWLDIEDAKKQKYVLARVSHDAANYGGRWFVVRYIGEGNWSLHPGYGVGDDYFSAFMPLPAPPIE